MSGQNVVKDDVVEIIKAIEEDLEEARVDLRSSEKQIEHVQRKLDILEERYDW